MQVFAPLAPEMEQNWPGVHSTWAHLQRPVVLSQFWFFPQAISLQLSAGMHAFALGLSWGAIVLASRADVQNGKAQVLLEVGVKLPEPAAKGKAPAKERLVQSIRLQKGRDELLWQR